MDYITKKQHIKFKALDIWVNGDKECFTDHNILYSSLYMLHRNVENEKTDRK